MPRSIAGAPKSDRSPTAIAIAKHHSMPYRTYPRHFGLGFEAAHSIERRSEANAFREKRKPRFRGRKA
jgi:hypothetical protein